MEALSQNPWPIIPSNPTDLQYFWYQLPFAVPGLTTFIVGFLLFVAGMIRAKKNGSQALLISFAISCLSFGTLGLLLGLRAIILNEGILLAINTILYPIVLLFTPMSCHILDQILEKKYRIIRWITWLNWGAVVFALSGIVLNRAFTGDFILYSFGKYPVSTFFLKPWGIIGVFSYFLFGVPCILHFLKHNSLKNKKTLLLAQNLLIILTASNLPSFVGIPFFPGGNFSFIPMLILAYGVFRSDFLNLSDFLFNKNALFYFLNAIIAFLFLGISGAVVYLLSPEELAKSQSIHWVFIPLISTLAVFWLGIIVGGTNPASPLNQIAAFSLYIYGAQLVSVLAINIISDPIIGLRITQISYVIFFLAPSIHIRFAYLALKRPLPKYFPVFDTLVFLLSIAALSPWLFVGYYEFPWGRILASGPVVQGFGAIGFIGILIVLLEWISVLKRKESDFLGNLAILFLVVGSIMLLLNLPATQGFPIYPLGNLTIIPTGILAYGVLKNSTRLETQQAFKISHRISLLSLSLIPLFTFLLFPFLPKSSPLDSRILYILLILFPILLLGYQLAFFLTRPISSELDLLLQKLDRAREEAEILAELTKRINSTSDLTEILQFVKDHISLRFGENPILALFTVNDAHQALALYHLISNTDSDIMDKISDLKIPLGLEGGILARTSKRQKPIYLAEIKSEWLDASPFDAILVRTFNLESVLHVPLVVQEKTLGVLSVTWSKIQSLTQKDLKEIASLGDQIAGAVQNAVLLQETKDSAEEIEELNQFARILNSSLDLDQVFQSAFDYIVSKTTVDTMWLLLKDKENGVLKTYSGGSAMHGLTEKEMQYFRDLEIPLNEAGGSMYQTFSEKEPLYIDDIRSENGFTNLLNGNKVRFSKLDLRIAKNCHLYSMFQIPLLLNQEVIGILNLTAFEKRIGLSVKARNKIMRICEQITTALHNASLYDQIKNLFTEAETSREKADSLLLNILPSEIAEELKEKGEVRPILYESATILFTDFKGFTQIAETLSPSDLIRELDSCFTQFDEIVHRYKLEKLKTIGDSYMCVGGIPAKNRTHAIDACLAALELQAFMNQMQSIKKQLGLPYWQMRIGIHTGPVIGGVIGKKKFAFDVWGDAVNTASRLESGGEVGKVNISQNTFELVDDFFKTEYRGTVPVKNKGYMAMYFLEGLREEYSLTDGKVPNKIFHEKYLSFY
ncbi:adenylate/guanylate cyclase domain-containing protein [Leptospira koniambonensis]|uniref:adenylate/guanylate cyclase domain-containing protein n=1 Tax=Leptospira koniambonensis TaxID=2484950 RepID=UPI003EBA7104